MVIEAGLRTRAACDAVIKRTVHELVGLDILVNNAGYQWAATRVSSR